MGVKVLHYVYNGPPIQSGYTLRTHSILKSEKKNGIIPSAAISVKSLFENYFRNLKFLPKNEYDGIKYYSAYNELNSDYVFKLISGFVTGNNKFTNRIKREFYSSRNKKILYKYYKYILSELGPVDLIHSHSPSITFNEAYTINQFLKKKLIYEVRGFWDLSTEDFNADIMKAVSLEINSCQKADKCIAISKGITDVLIKGGIHPNKIEIVPNGVDINKFMNKGKDTNLLKKFKIR